MELQKCTADRGMERVPFHDREMEISIQYHVMLIHQLNDQISMRCYINANKDLNIILQYLNSTRNGILRKSGLGREENPD